MWMMRLSLDGRAAFAQETAMRGFRTICAAVTLFVSSAAAAADEEPICPDRPSKSTGACTVPVGRWQVETGLIDWSYSNSDGDQSYFATVGSSLIKYGINSRTDVELGITPIEILRGPERASGIGDTLVRVKYRLTNEDSPVQAALDPFVKIPTANRRLGNGKVEGGLLVPLSAQLGKTGLTLSLDPELDLLADEDGHGRHAAMQHLVNLGASLGDQVSASVELWGLWDWDPAGTGKQRSADISFAYLPTKNLQLDWGANFGLNSQTSDVELYTGVSMRF
jgi:hypothetical protein